MQKLLIATHNPAKFQRYQALLEDFSDIQCVSLKDLGITEDVFEPYDNSRDNAIHKAKFYAEKSKMLTLAVDESVYASFLPENEQPGVFVRRIKKDNVAATDKEVLEYWMQLFEKYPSDEKFFTWDYQIAYIDPRTGLMGRSSVEMRSRVRIPFSDVILTGYPMSSFLVLPGSDRPHSEISDEEKKSVDARGFSSFVDEFRSWLKNLEK